MLDLNKYYDYLVNYEIATGDEIDLVTTINGYNEKALDDILFIRTGYRDLEQYLMYEDKENYREFFEDDEEEEDEEQ